MAELLKEWITQILSTAARWRRNYVIVITRVVFGAHQGFSDLSPVVPTAAGLAFFLADFGFGGTSAAGFVRLPVPRSEREGFDGIGFDDVLVSSEMVRASLFAL
jgi:hypothetical protein